MLCNSHAKTSVMRSAQRAANRPDVPARPRVHLAGMARWAEFVTLKARREGAPCGAETGAGSTGKAPSTQRTGGTTKASVPDSRIQAVAAESAAGLECAAAGRVICCEQVALATTSTTPTFPTSAPRAGAACTYDWPPRLSSPQGRRPVGALRRAHRSLAVESSVKQYRPLRSIARRTEGGIGMAPPRKVTLQVQELLEEIHDEARGDFHADDGVIDRTEQGTLAKVRRALYLVQKWEQDKSEAIYGLEYGLPEPPSPWHARQRRELRLIASHDDDPLEAA
jgi:hypothetical protein